MALLAASAFAQAGGHDPSRNILKTVLRLFLMARGEFDPSAAVVAINKANQAGSKSKSPLDWDKITRETYGRFSSVPMGTKYHDK